AITVTNVNENINAPVFTSGNSASTPENVLTSTVVYDVNAIDVNGDSITFSLSAGGDNDKFSIDSVTGEVKFLASPNFESPADAGGNNVYDIVVHANDGAHDTTQAVAISVTNVNDSTPVITSNGGGAAAAVSVAENSTAVTTVTATDADGALNPLTFSLVGGADVAKFAINGASGALSFLSAPDFEAPADAGSNNIYDVTVQVSDGTNIDTQAIAVTGTNVNENTNAPVFTSGNSVSTSENVLTTAVVYDANATDANGDPITFSLSAGGDNDRFSINSSTGEVRFLASPNFEAPADAGGNNVYDIVVHANDVAHDTTQAVAISVTNVNDSTPVI